MSESVAFQDACREKLGKGIQDFTNQAINAGYKPESDSLQDPSINVGRKIGEKMLRYVLSKHDCPQTARLCLILSNALVQEGIRLIASGVNPLSLKEALHREKKQLLTALEQLRQKNPAFSFFDLALKAASGNTTIAKSLHKHLKGVASPKWVNVEKGDKEKWEYDVRIVCEAGFDSSYFSTQKDRAKLSHPLCLITTCPVKDVYSILPMLNTISKTNQSLLIIAPEIAPPVLSMLITNQLQGLLRVCSVSVQNPLFIKAAASATKTRFDLSNNLTINSLGRARQALITKNDIQIILPKTTQSEYALHKGAICYTKEHLLDHYQKAIHYLQSIEEKGYLLGINSALLHASCLMPTQKEAGERVLQKAAQAPILNMLERFGCDSYVLQRLIKQGYPSGFDVSSRSLVPLSLTHLVSYILIEDAIEIAVKTACTVYAADVLIYNTTYVL